MQGNRARGWLLRATQTDRGGAERDITLHDWNVNYRGYVELFHTPATEKFVITCHSGAASIPDCVQLLIWIALVRVHNRRLPHVDFPT
jgi:hypothetical protein